MCGDEAGRRPWILTLLDCGSSRLGHGGMANDLLDTCTNLNISAEGARRGEMKQSIEGI